MGSILQNEVERVVKTKEDFIICEKSFVKSLELEIDFFKLVMIIMKIETCSLNSVKGLNGVLCDCFNKSFHR